jgi:hypothetical protein
LPELPPRRRLCRRTGRNRESGRQGRHLSRHPRAVARGQLGGWCLSRADAGPECAVKTRSTPTSTSSQQPTTSRASRCSDSAAQPEAGPPRQPENHRSPRPDTQGRPGRPPGAIRDVQDLPRPPTIASRTGPQAASPAQVPPHQPPERADSHRPPRRSPSPGRGPGLRTCVGRVVG